MTNTNPLMTAIHTALTGDSALTTLVGTKIYDDPPHQNHADFNDLPYVVYGDQEFSDYAGDVLDDAEEINLEIEAWSNYDGRKEVADIASRIKAVLHDQNLSVSGATLVNMRLSNAIIMKDPEDGTWKSLQTFRIVLQ